MKILLGRVTKSLMFLGAVLICTNQAQTNANPASSDKKSQAKEQYDAIFQEMISSCHRSG